MNKEEMDAFHEKFKALKEYSRMVSILNRSVRKYDQQIKLPTGFLADQGKNFKHTCVFKYSTHLFVDDDNIGGDDIDALLSDAPVQLFHLKLLTPGGYRDRTESGVKTILKAIQMSKGKSVLFA
jgi:hypothetical protein